MSVGRVCSHSVDIVGVNDSVHDAACCMRDRDVSVLVVVDTLQRPVGMLTAHDLVARALTVAPAEAMALAVGAVMTPNPNVIAEEAPLEAAVSLMTFAGARSLPVVDREGRIVGLVTLDGVTTQLAEELANIGNLLESQMPYRRERRMSKPCDVSRQMTGGSS